MSESESTTIPTGGPRRTNDDNYCYRRIVYITLEYCEDDLFSGNGICARSQVRGLSTLFPSFINDDDKDKNDQPNDDDERMTLIQEVIVARPLVTDEDGSTMVRPLSPSDSSSRSSNIRIHIVPVNIWKTTDRNFEHERFAQGVCDILSNLLMEDQIRSSSSNTDKATTTTTTIPPISALLAVDWTGMAGISLIPSHLLLSSSSSPSSSSCTIPIFFLNFRVYTRMTNISEEDRQFYYEAERHAVQLALYSGGGIMGLCHSDIQALKDMVKMTTTTTTTTNLPSSTRVLPETSRNQDPTDHDDDATRTNPVEIITATSNSEDEEVLVVGPSLPSHDQHDNHDDDDDDDDSFHVILPMLRKEFHEMAQCDRDKILDYKTRHRPYFVCMVRLSEDKGPQRFVQTCLDITKKDPTFWKRTKTIPILVGDSSSSKESFAKELQDTFGNKDILPEGRIISDFLDVPKLSTLLQETRLNLHPALYEAFGMTIVEAAACGVPTLMSNRPNVIGAEELISLSKGYGFGVNLEDQEELTMKVMELLEDDTSQPPSVIATTGQLAYHAAMTWTETQHCHALWQMIVKRIKHGKIP